VAEAAFFYVKTLDTFQITRLIQSYRNVMNLGVKFLFYFFLTWRNDDE